MSVKRAALLAFACGLAACAIHPLPENVTGYDTYTIVRKIRCEARDAIIKQAVVYLQRAGYPYDERTVLKLKFKDLRPSDTKLFEYFGGTGIVYAFTLDMTENNNAQFTADVIKPLSHGLFTLSPAAGDNLLRQNIRAFTVTDNFKDLVQKVDPSYCNLNFAPSGPNYQYPITGTIGIYEMVATFIDMTLFNNLGGKADVATTPKRGPPTMADTITFTTTISAGLTPKVTFTPVSNRFQLMDASLAATVSRIDKHSVIIGLGLANAPVSFNPLAGAFITSSPTSNGEAAAAQAVAQQINRFESTRSVIVAAP
jgi:hypothetical protein